MSWISDRICQLQSAFASFASPPTTKTTEAAASFQDLGSLKVTELRAIAKEKGLKGYTNLRKAQLIDLLDQN